MARRTLLDLIDELEPAVRDAFTKAVEDMRSDVRIAQLERAIRDRDIEAALRAVGVDAAYYRPLEEALRAAHLAGADWTFEQVKKASRGRVTGRFDSRNREAERVLAQWSSDKIVGIVESTKQAVRDSLTRSITEGRSPRSSALDIVGRVGPNGKRTGGIIGLDPMREEWVANMRDDLEQGNWSRYSGRKLRDRRFDDAVERYAKAGRPVPKELRERILTRYTSQLERLRGETIARTELLGSVHAAQDESLRQMVESGEITADNVKREWDASSDRFTRETHARADGQTRSQGEPFLVGGHQMRYPGDGTYAPAKEVINCRCHVRLRMDFVSGLRERLTEEERRQVRELM